MLWKRTVLTSVVSILFVAMVGVLYWRNAADATTQTVTYTAGATKVLTFYANNLGTGVHTFNTTLTPNESSSTSLNRNDGFVDGGSSKKFIFTDFGFSGDTSSGSTAIARALWQANPSGAGTTWKFMTQRISAESPYAFTHLNTGIVLDNDEDLEVDIGNDRGTWVEFRVHASGFQEP